MNLEDGKVAGPGRGVIEGGSYVTVARWKIGWILRNGGYWENWVYFVRCLEPVHRQPLEGYPAPFYFRAWRFFPSPLVIYHSVISSLSCLHYGK